MKKKRQLTERIYKRGWNTTIFWGTQKIQTKTINLNIINDGYYQLKTYTEYIIITRNNKREILDTHNFRSMLNPNINKIYRIY